MPSRRRIGARHRAQLPEHPPDAASERAGERAWSGSIAATAASRGVLQPVNLLPRNRWRERGARGARRGGARRLRACDRRQPALRRAEAHRAGARADGAAAPALARRAGRRASIRRRPRRCRSQLDDICRGGDITLLVVEHDMHFIGALCEEVIVLRFRPQDRRRHARRDPPQRAGPGDLSRRTREGTAANASEDAAVQLEVHDLEVRYGRVHAVRGVSLDARRAARSSRCSAPTAPASRRCCARCWG